VVGTGGVALGRIGLGRWKRGGGGGGGGGCSGSCRLYCS
jgi:hypothetical protein